MKTKMLSIIAIFLTAAMLFSVTSFATDEEILYTDSYEVLSSSNRATSKYLFQVSRICMTDAAWNNTILGYGPSTIGSQGALLTSFTMIYNYWRSANLYSGSYMNPNDMNTTLKNYGAFYLNDDRLSYSLFGSCFGFNYDSSYSSMTIINAVKSAIDADRPLVIDMTNAAGNRNYVLAYGYNGTTIYIKDPNTVNYTTLSQYLNSGYTVNSCFAFS